MESNGDGPDLGERLARIESQIRQIKVILTALLIVVAVGLPGALATILGAGMAALLMGAAVVVAWLVLHLFDLILLRRAREKREAEMARKILEGFQPSESAHEDCGANGPPAGGSSDRGPQVGTS